MLRDKLGHVNAFCLYIKNNEEAVKVISWDHEGLRLVRQELLRQHYREWVSYRERADWYQKPILVVQEIDYNLCKDIIIVCLNGENETIKNISHEKS